MPRVTKATNKKETKSTGKADITASKSVATDKTKKAKTAAKKSVVSDAKKVTASKPVAKSTIAKKTTAKKSPAKPSKKVTSKAPAKKTVSKSSKSKKSTTQKKKPTAKKPTVSLSEYYDLPYRYNQTVVKVLAQTPNTLFVYWDISDNDREKYVKEFGEYFFNDTYPVLIVHNKTMNYYFEIEVNDFANSWYFHVSDAHCDYEIEFGRRKKSLRDISIPNDYVYITSSNVIEAPNDKFLFEPNTRNLFFRNVKTNQEFSKDIATLSFMEKINKIYNIYDVYKEIYKEEDLIDAMNNPTSSGSGLSFYKKN